MRAGLLDRYHPGAHRTGGADTREPTVLLEHAIVLGQFRQAGWSAPASRVTVRARAILETMAARGWAELQPATTATPVTWVVTAAGQQAWGEVGGAQPVVLP